MRGAIVFAGSSHPKLVEGICDRLGMKPGSATLGKFKNGETSVTIRERSPIVFWRQTFFSLLFSLSASLLTRYHRYINSQQGCLHCPER